MLIQPLDLNIANIKEWLLQFTSPVVIFAFSSWRRVGQCNAMKELLEQLARRPEYQRDVLFCWTNLDDGYGDSLLPIGINDAPQVKIFLRGKERGRFVDAGTREGIITLLNILLDPAKRHHPVKGSLEPVGQESPFYF